MPRKKSVNSSKNYFDVVEEQAVVDYLFGDPEEREKVYNDKLSDPLNKMVESIIKRYKLMRDDISIEDLINDTLSNLLTKFEKFKPERNKKAYSYYGTVCANYLRQQMQKYSVNKNRYLSYEDLSSDLEENNKLTYELDIEQQVETYDFIPMIIDRLNEEIKTNTKLKVNDVKVGHAVIDLLENWEDFIGEEGSSDNLNRNKILYYLRESTNLTKKDVRNSMKKYKVLYMILKDEVYDDVY